MDLLNAKKIQIACLAFLLLASDFFCIHAENLSQKFVIQTKYFDVIYQIPSEQIAKNIAQNIDEIYLSLRKSLNVKDDFYFKNFPIYIEWTTQELNAYYTDFPYRHIVLFDTTAPDSLRVFSDTMSGVLRHELSHAVSLSLQEKGFRAFSNVFWNGLSAALYSMPQSLKEGLAVVEESQMQNVGRLNNPYSMHIVKQSFLDGTFPDFDQITGARDIKPIGDLPYIFGAAFSDFVIKKYSKEKYCDFIKSCNNQILNYFWIYKKIFKTSIKDDWAEFKNFIGELIQSENPTLQNLVELDFKNFDFHQEKNLSYEKLTSFNAEKKSGLAYLISEKNEVWYLENNIEKPLESDFDKNNFQTRKKIKPKKLFTMKGISKLTFSSDGRFLTICRLSPYTTYKNQIKIFDIEKKSFINFSKKDYKDGAMISFNNEYFFAAIKSVSQNSSIELYKFSSEKNSKNKFEFYKKINFDFNEVPYNLIDAGFKNFAFLQTENFNTFISLYDIELDSLSQFSIPENIFVKDLSCMYSSNFVSGQSGFLFSFSYTKKNTFPRLAFLSLKINNDKKNDKKIENQNFYFLQNDFSGGVYNPVFFDITANKNDIKKFPPITCNLKFFDNTKISFINSDFYNFEKINANYNSFSLKNNFENNLKNDFSINENSEIQKKYNQKKFSPFLYFTKGVFIPLGIVPLYSNQFEIFSDAFLGATWISDNYFVSAGFNPFNLTYGALFGLYGNSQTQNFTYNLFGTALFEKDHFAQTYEQLDLSYIFPVGNFSNLILNNSTNFFYGKSYEMFNEKKLNFSFSSENFLTVASQSNLNFSTIRKSGNSIFEKKGIAFGALFTAEYISKLNSINNEKLKDAYGFNLGFNLKICLPRLLPFENPQNILATLPLSLTASIFQSLEKFAKYDASLVLFSMEVQKGTGEFFIPLYLNRFYFTLNYSGAFYYSDFRNMAIVSFLTDFKNFNFLDLSYEDYFSFGANLDFTINTGVLQNLGALNFKVEILYYLNQLEKNKNQLPVKLKICNKLVF